MCKNKSFYLYITSLIGFFFTFFNFLNAQTWQAGSSDWNTAGNWTPADVPDTNTETATFSSTGSTTVDLSANTIVQGVVFGANSQAYTIQSGTGNHLTVDINSAGSAAAVTTSSTSGAVIFNNLLRINDTNAGGGVGTATFSLATGSTVTLNGGLTVLGAFQGTATATGSGTLNINGAVNLGSGSFSNNTASIVNFNPSSTTSINSIRSQSNGGKMNLLADFNVGVISVGFASGGNSVGTMYLGTAGMSMSRNFTFLSGTTGGVANMTFGADMTSGGTATQAGTITLATGSGGGTFTNNIDATDANDTFQITGVISGTQGSGTTNIRKTGNGTVIFGGTSANTFASGAGTMSLQVSSGTLALNKTAGVDAITNVTTTIDSGATLRWDASNQVNNSASMVLNGGTMNFNGQSETMGSLDLNASSFMGFGSAAETIVFADSSAQNWGTFTLTLTGFSNDSLRFGTSNTALTAGQLALFRFMDFGGVAAQIDVNGFVTALANNADLVVATSYTGTSNVTQNGTGSLTLTGTNTSTGTATVTSGTMVIGTEAGGNWAGNVIVNGGTLKGRGQITGSLTLNGGVYSAGNSPGIHNVGTFTVNSGGTHLVEIDGSSAGNGSGFYDQTISAGAVTLNGGTLQGFTTFSGSTGFNPGLGTRINFLQGSSITGSYTTLDFSANNAGKSWMLEYRNTEANLFAVPADWGRDIAGMNANQTRLGKALQSFRVQSIDHRRPLNDAETIFNGLMRLDNGGLKSAYDQLSPDSFQAMNQSVMNLGRFSNGSTDQRLHQIRRGDTGVSLNGMSMKTLDGDYEYESLALDKGTMLVQKKKQTLKNGFFVNTTGSYTKSEKDEKRIGFENRLGGITAGIDREITKEITLGAFASQGYADTILLGGGSLEAHSGRIGMYGSYHKKGFYLNSSLSGGITTFESERRLSFIDQRAKGSTQGYDLSGQINTGLDFQSGNWVWGPTTKIDYGYQSIEKFHEKGSAARLKVDEQNQTHVETGLGMKVSRPFDYKGWKWVPEVKVLGSYQWLEPGKIQARFAAGGDRFEVRPEGSGQTTIIPGAGMQLYFNEYTSMNLSYESRVNLHSLSHQLDLGWTMKF